MDIRKTRTCERCKSVVPLDQVRLYPKDQNRNLLVCGGCCAELKKATAGEIAESKVKTLSPPNFLGYFCSRCNYNFRADRSKAGITYNLCCPYCGKNDRLETRRSSTSGAPKASSFSERKA